MPDFSTHDGALINFYEEGCGLPVVFLHGWLMSGRAWEYQHTLSTSYRVIAPDLRGHGSSSSGKGFSYASCSRDLLRLLDHLGLDKVTLVGWSMGAQIAINSWPLINERLTGMVLVGGTPRFCCEGNYLHGMTEEKVRGMEISLKRNYARTASDFFSKMFADNELNTSDILQLSQRVLSLLPAAPVAFAALSSLVMSDFRPVIPSIDKPVLLIHGDMDTICLPGAAQYMTDMLPMAHLEIFPGIGHAPFMTRPARFNLLISDFIRKINGRY